jgi:hypothetical protein
MPWRGGVCYRPDDDPLPRRPDQLVVQQRAGLLAAPVHGSQGRRVRPRERGQPRSSTLDEALDEDEVVPPAEPEPADRGRGERVEQVGRPGEADGDPVAARADQVGEAVARHGPHSSRRVSNVAASSVRPSSRAVSRASHRLMDPETSGRRQVRMPGWGDRLAGSDRTGGYTPPATPRQASPASPQTSRRLAR